MTQQIQLTKIEKRITEMQLKATEINEIKQQSEHLKKLDPDKAKDYEERTGEITEKFSTLVDPLEVRRKELIEKKEMFKFLRDTEDENMWLEEKMNMVTSDDYGSSLQEVNLLIKKNKTLKGEIENHEPRIRAVCEDGQR